MTSDRAITIANDETLSELIKSANRRIVVLTPALSIAVAEQVAAKWRELGPEAVSVVVDVDTDVQEVNTTRRRRFYSGR